MQSTSINKEFYQRFRDEPLVVRSPGRINLIGEHTDYNQGFVLPAAIDKYVFTAVSKRNDEQVCMDSVQFNQRHLIPLEAIKPIAGLWTNYILGVVDQLLKRGYHPGGFNMVVEGDIPLGAGLSSSAAMECSVATALNELFKLQIGKLELVRIAQAAEHDYAGVQCGIMDPFASVFGKKDHVISLDCRDLSYQYVPLDISGYKLVLFDSHVKHKLAETAYNTRKQECEEGIMKVQQKYPEVRSLRDTTLNMLGECISNPVLLKRCSFIVKENDRLLTGCQDLQNGDILSFGKKMFQTHDGLSKDYAVSCPELDFLVNEVSNNPAVAGSRMMGGGFGGCTINIIEEGAVDVITGQLMKSYEEKMGKTLSAYMVNLVDGTEIVSNKVSINE